MSINIGPPAVDDMRPKITVIGVGGAGGNAIANMIAAQIEGVDFIVANTDAQALGNASASKRIQLGPDITGGLGAGARPEVGKAAAEETVAEIEDALEGVNMCFIAAGMGGGTGTGAAPVPVPPPMPAAMNSMFTPSSESSISPTVSSAAALPTSGRAPAPSPPVMSGPSWMRLSDEALLRACASVLATMKSTPSISALIMLAIALPPAPPTPMTMIFGRSSSMAGGPILMLITNPSGEKDGYRRSYTNRFVSG